MVKATHLPGNLWRVAVHQSWFAGTIAGAAFTMAVYHRGRITDAVVAHMTANALIAATAIGFG